MGLPEEKVLSISFLSSWILLGKIMTLSEITKVVSKYIQFRGIRHHISIKEKLIL